MRRRRVHIACKRCQAVAAVKNGYVRNQQRYQCTVCGYRYIVGDARRQGAAQRAKRAQCRQLYGPGFSYGFLAKCFGVSRSTVYAWVKQGSSR